MRPQNYIITLAVLLVLLVPMAAAFGVTAPIPSGNYAIINPGESKDFTIMLQNMAGSEDVQLKGYVIEGAEFAQFVDNDKAEYFIPFNSKDIPVTVRITIPEGAKRYDIYNVGVLLRQVIENDGRMVQLSGGIRVNLPISVTALEQPRQELPLSLPLAATILVIVGAASLGGYFAYRKKKD